MDIDIVYPWPEEGGFSMSRASVLDELYDRLSQQARFSLADYRRQELPKNGVYFFFEGGEFRRDGITPRVVRVGTHGLHPTVGDKRDPRTMKARLREHFGVNHGGGSHRGSIFRKLVGQARSEGRPASWGIANRTAAAKAAGIASADLREFERPHEERVSATLRAMSVVCIAADSIGDRAALERGAISLLSNVFEPLDTPSTGWVGKGCAPHPQVIASGLWNQQHVDAEWDDSRDAESAFLRLLPERAV